MTAEKIGQVPPYICPACRVAVSPIAEGFQCGACGKTYPVICGIPDFRIRPDRYLSFEDERAKAMRLFEYARRASFEELVDFYYSITDDVPSTLAPKFARYVHDAPRRATRILDILAPEDGDGILLDVGCGSGGGLVAAPGRFAARVGVDIGLRWLVIGQKRLAEMDIQATLVCADVAALPFADGGFTHIVADDLIEHSYDPEAAIAAMAHQLRPGGKLWVSAINRFWIGPHPAVHIWGAGLMPKPVRSRVTRMLRGVDSLRNIEMVSSGGILRAGRRSGMQVVLARARSFGAQGAAHPSGFVRRIVSIYERLVTWPVFGAILFRIGPAFEILFRRNTEYLGI